MKISEKQKAFCEEYLIDLNGTQAAIRAGYNPKTADQQASRLLTNVKVRAYLSDLMQKKASRRIASADDVLVYLTSVLNGQSESEVLVTRSLGKDSGSEIVHEKKKPDEKDRLRAAEILSRYHGLMAPQQVEVKTDLKLDQGVFSEMMKQIREMTPDEKETYRMMLKDKMKEDP